MSTPRHSRAPDPGLRPRGLRGGRLRRARQSQAAADHGPGGRRSAHDDDRSRQLARRSARPDRPGADGAHAQARRALQHRSASTITSTTSTCRSGRSGSKAIAAHYTCDALIIATGATAKYLGLPSEAEFPRSRRVRLRDLRRLLLQEPESRGRRRRQHRGRGSAVSREHRLARHARASPRHAARGKNPAGSSVRARARRQGDAPVESHRRRSARRRQRRHRSAHRARSRAARSRIST